jgi:hypothetical protein
VEKNDFFFCDENVNIKSIAMKNETRNTIFLFTPASLVPLIDTLYCANSQNDGYNEKKYSSNDSCSDSFVFDLALDDVRDLFA